VELFSFQACKFYILAKMITKCAFVEEINKQIIKKFFYEKKMKSGCVLN